jgi:hypothetical protein
MYHRREIAAMCHSRVRQARKQAKSRRKSDDQAIGYQLELKNVS